MRQIVCVCSMRTLVPCMQWCNGNIEPTASTASTYQLWTVVDIRRLHVIDHSVGILVTKAPTAHRYMHKTIGICGILLCISGRSAIDLGGIYWVMVATKIHFSQFHALCGSPHDIMPIALP